jgi:hypothetical protein
LGIKSYDWTHDEEGLYFSSAEIRHWFKDIGYNAWDKRIPRWTLSYPQKELKYLLDGIIDGDRGSTLRDTVTTTSFGLIQDLIELGVKCGLDVSFYQKSENPVLIKSKEPASVRDMYVACFSYQNKRIKPSDRTVEKDYKGKIWCLRLEENKNFIVERNGKTIFCGNTDKSYGGSSPSGGYKEDTPFVVSDAYCTSKACGDMIVRSYARTFDIPACVIRAGNLYGPRDLNLSRLIPKSILKLLRGERPILYTGAAKFIREFIYVDDILDVYMMLLEKGEPGEAYNVGGTPPQKILDVINMMSTKITGSTAAVQMEKVDFPEIPEQHLNAEKLYSFGWRAKTDISTGLDKTIEWYKTII